MLMYLGLLAVLLILVLLLKIAQSTGKNGNGSNWTFKINSVPTVLTTAIDSMGTPTKIVFNGQEYSSPEEMPPDARAAYDLAMKGVLADADRDGTADIFKQFGGAHGFTAKLGAGRPSASTEAATRLKQLQELRNSGLITNDEYEAKRTEILDKI